MIARSRKARQGTGGSPGRTVGRKPYRRDRGPNDSATLFDFNPSVDPYRDVAGGLALTWVGSPKLYAGDEGQFAVEFDGSSYLLGDGSPFGALSDLTGGVSIYVVAERTDTPASAKGVVSLNETAGSANVNAVDLTWNANGSATVTCANSSASRTDSTDAVMGSGVVHGLSCHVTTTSRTAKVSGYGGAAADVNANDPDSLDRLCIGGSLLASSASADPGSLLEGRIYRVVIKEGAFEQDFADYLASLYVPLRLPPALDPSDIAFVWDARHSPYRDTLNGANLTPTGTPSLAAAAGDVFVEFGAASADYLSADAPFAGFSGNMPVAIYAVGVADTTGAGGFLSVSIQDTTFTAESLSSVIRVGVGNLALVYDASAVSQSNTASLGVAGQVHQATAELTSTTLTTWLDGAQGSAAATSGKTPSSLDALHIGGQPGGAARLAGKCAYLLVVNASRAAEVEAWLAATFPVGESV